MLDKHAGEQIELIGAMGERVQTLGGVAIADPRHVAEVTKLKRPPNGVEEVPMMLSRLLEAHELIISQLREAINNFKFEIVSNKVDDSLGQKTEHSKLQEETMKTLLKRFALLLSSMTCVSAYLVLPASADSTADLVLSLKCHGGYNVNVWKRHDSGELLYRSTSPQGNLSLGKGNRDNTGAAQVYKFKNGNYEYQVIGGRGDHPGQGTLEVYKNDRSIMSQTCIPNG